MKVTLIGTGTSQGVPVPACECDVCTKGDKKDNRLRTSALVEVDDNVFCIDAGPDFRYQMLRNNVKKLDAIIVTHSHRDHIAGLDDVRSFNYVSRKPMPIYTTEFDQLEIKREFSYAFKNNYPGLPKYDLITIDDKVFEINGTQILPVKVMHFNNQVLGFRINDFAYVTDTNFIPPLSMELLKGCDVLVLNALRREKHPTHFNLEEALKVIDHLKPKKAYLTHISHLMGFHNDLQNELPKGVFAAYDGLVINS
ncbi:MAG: MBL fold metallo-hydrolase [Lentimicrobiaceae bacterium]|jgi:phosphoribosyl 1,2-cyclic phosphate phosphodiesterase|nr:MBL fold metallo-hydrolase [Lentimicrobiaceae bacterium]MBT3454586.1 MBL fold metallo-hydrolase [Lentimicrobiaceae bacterium]MBT3818284.1 MBL fold metallo-hydrolase [Lentimicrobiaceae bacterium]MBT4062235.1 MBL fold metallo-hydrolase [Lentimicrobiaceae bacterium]MBT4190062.1 MBL fold metallo-hydrolase [Lentimicrobiaceae bacterium]